MIFREAAKTILHVPPGDAVKNPGTQLPVAEIAGELFKVQLRGGVEQESLIRQIDHAASDAMPNAPQKKHAHDGAAAHMKDICRATALPIVGKEQRNHEDCRKPVKNDR